MAQADYFLGPTGINQWANRCITQPEGGQIETLLVCYMSAIYPVFVLQRLQYIETQPPTDTTHIDVFCKTA